MVQMLDAPDVLEREPPRVPVAFWALLLLIVGAGAVMFLLTVTEDDGAAAPVAGPSTYVRPSTSPAVTPPTGDACREVILALNDVAALDFGMWPPLSGTALETVSRSERTIAGVRPLLSPTEANIAGAASDALNAIVLGVERVRPLESLRASASAMDAACRQGTG